MGSLVNTLLRTLVLDDSAYQEWRERPNLFLRGIVLIVLVSLVAGLISFAVTLVEQVKPVDIDEIEASIYESFEWQYQFNPSMQDPEVREMMDDMVDVILPMVADLSDVSTPLPRGINGFFTAVSGWLSRAVNGSIWSLLYWMAYGALMLIVVNLLGGSAKLTDFLGMTSLYVIPGLLLLLGWVPCVGLLLVLIGLIWSAIVCWKAVAVASGLDGGKALVALLAPVVVIVLLGMVMAALWFAWFAIIF